MRILDMLKGRSDVFKKRELLLEEASTQHWAAQLVEHSGLDKEFKAFTDRVEETKEGIKATLKPFTDEDTLAAIPDRARTINAIHGKEYATQVEKLLKAASFSDLFGFDAQQEAYFEASSGFKDTSAKHTSVLKEFMHDELKESQERIQELEDTIIAFLKTLEERKFPLIRKLHDTSRKLVAMTERQEKYERLLTSLRDDLKRTVEKRQQIETQIAEQRGLIRNEQSLASLTKMQQLEEELFHLAAQYETLAKDLHTLYNKHPELKMDDGMKKAIAELQKDHMQFLTANAELVKKAFEGITQQLEEENLGNRNLLERLARLAGSVEADGRRIATSQPDLRSLKRDAMKDVAALQVYDRQQSLLRAQHEENTLQMKITYLEQELDPKKRLVMEREMKDTAKGFGAIIKAREPETKKEGPKPDPDVEEPEVEPEHEDAALK